MLDETVPIEKFQIFLVSSVHWYDRCERTFSTLLENNAT